MKNQLLISATLLASTLFASCDKSNTTSNPAPNSNKASLSYELKVVNKNAAISNKGTAGGSIQWTTAVARPTLVKFEAKQNGVEQELKSTNTNQIDLMSSVDIVFGNFTLAAGTYSEIELKIQLNKSGSAPALQMEGQFTNGTVTIPVSFEVNEFIELKAEQENVTISNNTSFTSVTTLDLSAFTSGITEAMITAGSLTGGTLVISSSSNQAIYSIILANIESMHHSSHFEHD
jgi:hypothetical protein